MGKKYDGKKRRVQLSTKITECGPPPQGQSLSNYLTQAEVASIWPLVEMSG